MNKTPFVAILSVLLIAGISRADDFTLSDGTIYTNCVVKRVEPDGILVADDDGIRKVKFTKLAPEVQKKYGFDPAKAGEYESASKQAAIARDNQINADFKAKQEATAREKDEKDPSKVARGVVFTLDQEKPKLGGSVVFVEATPYYAGVISTGMGSVGGGGRSVYIPPPEAHTADHIFLKEVSGLVNGKKYRVDLVRILPNITISEVGWDPVVLEQWSVINKSLKPN